MIKKLTILVIIVISATVIYGQTIPKLKMIDVVNRFDKKSDTIYVINFWATFCKPCVAEIPDFIKITNKYKMQKVKLILVSLDLPAFYPGKIAGFVKKNNFTADIVWLNETNADVFCPMIASKWSGSIPATVIINAKTGSKFFVEGELKPEELENEIKSMIKGER